MTTSRETPETPAAELTSRGRWLVVATAFLGWMWAGVAMSVVPLAGREISKSFLGLDAG